MAYRFTRQRVRLGVDVGVKEGAGAIKDVITGEPPKFSRNAGLQIEVALLYNGSVIDISNVIDAVLEIKSTSVRGSALAMTKTIGQTMMNRALTDAQWKTGEASMAHFIFTFLSTETADSVFGSPGDEVDHWLVLWGHTDDATTDVDVFGMGLIKSRGPGISGAASAPPAAQGGITLDQINAMLQSYLKVINDPGITCTFVNATSGQRVKISADSDGNLGVETQATT